MARGVGVELLIKHEAKPSALSRNETPAIVGENALSLARRLSMRFNRTSLSCAMLFLSSQKNNYLLPLLLSFWLAS